MREYPVMVAVLGHVHHVSEDFASRLDAVPQEIENTPGHVRMPNDAMRLAQQFFFLVPGDPNENPVRVGNVPRKIRLGHYDFVGRENAFDPGGHYGESGHLPRTYPDMTSSSAGVTWPLTRQLPGPLQEIAGREMPEKEDKLC
jgi:hypothetical protein